MIYVAYSHENFDEMQRFARICAPMKEKHNETIWMDRRLKAGDWEKQLTIKMGEASAAVFLVSTHSLDSQFIMKTELPYFIRAHEDRGIPLVWVLLERCAWKHTKFADYQGACINGKIKAYADLTRAEGNELFCEAVDMLNTAFLDLERPVIDRALHGKRVPQINRDLRILAKPSRREVEVLLRSPFKKWWRMRPIAAGEVTNRLLHVGDEKHAKPGDKFTLVALTTDRPLQHQGQWKGKLPRHRTASAEITIIRT